MSDNRSQNDANILQTVEKWLKDVVIGLNLCPFAKHPFDNQQVHFAVSKATSKTELLEDLATESSALINLPPSARETTVLIVPKVLGKFEDYNDFLDYAEGLIERMGWADDLQIASFHPDYQFAQTEPEDAENLTNRAPYPILHLIRQASIEKVLEHYPHDPETIFENNIACVQNLTEAQKRELFPYLFS